MNFNNFESSFLENFPHAVIIVDTDLNIFFNNDKFKHINSKSLETSLSSINISIINKVKLTINNKKTLLLNDFD